MKINFILTEQDYLTHLLYSASKTPAILKKRKRNRFLLPVLYVAVGFFGMLNGKIVLFLCLVALALLWYSGFPNWEKNQYVKHYKKYIKNNLSDLSGKENVYDFRQDGIYASEDNSEPYKIAWSEIHGLYEIPDALYLGLNSGHTIILPKQAVPETDALKHLILENPANPDIKVVNDPDWKW